MKTVIYYYSKTGHTEKYAESLKSRILCDAYPIKNMKYKKMKDFDTIIFMSPVHGNKIKYIDKFLKLYKKIKDKNLIVVAVGMQPSTPDRRETLIIVNLLKYYHIRLYELQSGFNMKSLPWYLRKLMTIGLKVASKKEPLLKGQEGRINNLLNFPIEYNDYVGIDRIMDTIRKLERESKIIEA